MGTFLPKAWLILGLATAALKGLARYPLLENASVRPYLTSTADIIVNVTYILTLSLIYTIFCRVARNKTVIFMGWTHLTTYTLSGIAAALAIYLNSNAMASRDIESLRQLAIAGSFVAVISTLSTVCFFIAALLVAREAKSQFRPSDFD